MYCRSSKDGLKKKFFFLLNYVKKQKTFAEFFLKKGKIFKKELAVINWGVQKNCFLHGLLIFY